MMASSPSSKDLDRLNERIITCRRCSRLRAHCRLIASRKRRAYHNETYWGKPVPSFGDPKARLLVVGLAPAAHGGNRTGRIFTGDSSGNWLYEALHRFGFANQPNSFSRDDGLVLKDAWITAINHCAPPRNKPTLDEQANCRPFLVEELRLLRRLEVILVLGRIAFDGIFRVMSERGFKAPRPRPEFKHRAVLYPFGPQGPVLVCSFHPSRQNTNTGKLTRSMFLAPFRDIRRVLDGQTPSSRYGTND